MAGTTKVQIRAAALALLLLPTSALATGFKVLHSFSGSDGTEPYGALIADPSGGFCTLWWR